MSRYAAALPFCRALILLLEGFCCLAIAIEDTFISAHQAGMLLTACIRSDNFQQVTSQLLQCVG